MSTHNLILEPFKGIKSRYTCPECGKRHEFARYINTETEDYIADHVGRCNREVNCGYHYTPKQFYQENPKDDVQPVKYKPATKKSEPPPIVCLPADLFEKSLCKYVQNNFYLFVRSLFGETIALDLMASYCVGTSKHWAGATVFWQVDCHGNIRQAKIMLYNPDSGRRIKNDGDKIFFAGKKLLQNQSPNLVQCFFGEILLSIFPDKSIGIVESEKTAMIASVYFPELVWLATGGSNGCRWTTKEVCQVLRGRKVILFPDLGFFEKWKGKAKTVQQLISCEIAVSDLLEKSATDEERNAGWDLADYLLMNRDSIGWAMTTENYPLIWDI